jgi:hypothetical protein
VIIGTSALALAACGSEASNDASAEGSGNAEYRIDRATGETTMTLKGKDGTASLRSGAGVPVNLPDGFSLFPGTEVITSTLVRKDDGEGTMVIFKAPAEGEAILAHYREQANAAGFAIEIEMNTGGTRMIGGTREGDGSTFSVTVSPGDGDASTGQLIIGSKPAG